MTKQSLFQKNKIALFLIEYFVAFSFAKHAQ